MYSFGFKTRTEVSTASVTPNRSLPASPWAFCKHKNWDTKGTRQELTLTELQYDKTQIGNDYNVKYHPVYLNHYLK